MNLAILLVAPERVVTTSSSRLSIIARGISMRLGGGSRGRAPDTDLLPVSCGDPSPWLGGLDQIQRLPGVSTLASQNDPYEQASWVHRSTGTQCPYLPTARMGKRDPQHVAVALLPVLLAELWPEPYGLAASHPVPPTTVVPRPRPRGGTRFGALRAVADVRADVRSGPAARPDGDFAHGTPCARAITPSRCTPARCDRGALRHFIDGRGGASTRSCARRAAAQKDIKDALRHISRPGMGGAAT